MVRGRRLTTLVASAAILAGLAVATPAATAATAAGTAATPPGAPGAPSYFDLARKDCVGTAAGTGSKVWYTVAGGVLSDVYEPTIDNTNVSTLQYVVTDGSTFTDMQARDMTWYLLGWAGTTPGCGGQARPAWPVITTCLPTC